MDQRAVAVLGASSEQSRYSNMAVRLLKEHGYQVIPVTPEIEAVEGIPAVPSLQGIKERVHTLTMYVNPRRGMEYLEEILNLKPRRVIFNPGSESDQLENLIAEAGIPVLRACTLVLLKTGQFEKNFNERVL